MSLAPAEAAQGLRGAKQFLSFGSCSGNSSWALGRVVLMLMKADSCINTRWNAAAPSCEKLEAFGFPTPLTGAGKQLLLAWCQAGPTSSPALCQTKHALLIGLGRVSSPIICSGCNFVCFGNLSFSSLWRPPPRKHGNCEYLDI